MTIKHHPDDATLMSYAAGSIAEPLAAVVAAHLDRCPRCAGVAGDMEMIGASMMSALPASALEKPAPAMALRRMEAEVIETASSRGASSGDVPGPLSPYIGMKLDDINWKWLSPGVWHHRLPVRGANRGDLRLLKLAPGSAMPEHGHGGAELTLVLRGSYHDEIGTFAAGDVADLDDEVNHRPIADKTSGCICLIASEKRARFKGVLARLVQPFTGV